MRNPSYSPPTACSWRTRSRFCSSRSGQRLERQPVACAHSAFVASLTAEGGAISVGAATTIGSPDRPVRLRHRDGQPGEALASRAGELRQAVRDCGPDHPLEDRRTGRQAPSRSELGVFSTVVVCSDLTGGGRLHSPVRRPDQPRSVGARESSTVGQMTPDDGRIVPGPRRVHGGHLRSAGSGSLAGTTTSLYQRRPRSSVLRGQCSWGVSPSVFQGCRRARIASLLFGSDRADVARSASRRSLGGQP